MFYFWLSLVLLSAQVNARPQKRQESQLFLSLSSKRASSGSVSQCDEVGLTFGGGIAPYTFVVWSEDQSYGVSEMSVDTGGAGIWSIQSNPMQLSLHLKDSAGSTVESQSFAVLSGTMSCYDSTPVIRLSDQGTTSTPNSTSSTNGPPASLEDCRQNGPARCKFTATGQSGVYFQQALIGNVFANCYSNKSVKQTFTGTTTITDNWSVQVGPEFGTMVNKISVTAQVSRGEARTVTQTFEWDVDPGQQTALVAVGKFNGISGAIDMSYSNGSSVRLEDAVYFQSTGEKATVTRLDIGCGENWPSWNATTATNGVAAALVPGRYGLGVLAFLLAFLLLS
ncbi:unnamed protein product [Rhizoctonia solani]|uniref:Uncharacterized protein n=1 Tax=Rhizoctonia solani TaxID=456999 RepID=A0A8H3CGL9_9AGAM|nr:unnamed protein product [Rhizoctonia solani]